MAVEMDWEALAKQAAALAGRGEDASPRPREWSEAERQVSSGLILSALRRRDLAALDRAEELFGGVPLDAPKGQAFRQLLWEASSDPQAFGFKALAVKMRRQCEREEGEAAAPLGRWLRLGMEAKTPFHIGSSGCESVCRPLMACFEHDNVAALGAILADPQWFKALALEEPSRAEADKPLGQCLAWQAAIRNAPRCVELLCALEPFCQALLPWAFDPEPMRWEGIDARDQKGNRPSKGGLFERALLGTLDPNVAVAKRWQDAAWSMMGAAPKNEGPLAGPGSAWGWADLLIASRGFAQNIHRHAMMADVLAKTFNTGPQTPGENKQAQELRQVARRCADMGVAPDWQKQAKDFAFAPTLAEWFELQGQVPNSSSGPAARL